MTTGRGHALSSLAATAALVALALAATPGAARPACALADGDFHVALVVTHGDHTVYSQCVAFNPGTPTFDAGNRSISGEEVLLLSQVKFQAVDYGGSLGQAVCQVDAEPAGPPGGFTTRNCFGNPYWVLWRASSSGGWTSAGSGVSNLRFADGEAQGLSFGGTPGQGPHGLCPAAQPWPAAPSTARAAGGTPPAAGSSSGRGGTAPGTAAGGAAATTPGTVISASPVPATSTATSSRHGPRGGAHPVSPSGLGLGAAMAAALARARNTWSASAEGWVAAVGAVLALTGLLLAQVFLIRRAP